MPGGAAGSVAAKGACGDCAPLQPAAGRRWPSSHVAEQIAVVCRSKAVEADQELSIAAWRGQRGVMTPQHRGSYTLSTGRSSTGCALPAELQGN